MKNFYLNPKHINQPIQLLGASLIGSVLLVGEFLYASVNVPSQIMSWFYCVTAILIFPIILYFIFILQTKYRVELQGDQYFNESMKMYHKESNQARKFILGEV